MNLDPTLRSHFDILYRRQRLFGKSPNTVRLYHYTLRYFDEFLGHVGTIDDLTDENVMGCMERIVERGLSIRTANKTRDQLCALWNFLARKGITKQFPECPSLPQPLRTPVAWSRSELSRLWEMLAAQGGWICGIKASSYWLALHSVAYDTLERIGAVRLLEWTDLRSDCRWAWFRPETRKGRRVEFTAKLHPTTTALLESIRLPERQLVFPWEQHPSYFWTKYKMMRRRAALPTDAAHSFHCLRRTAASFAEAAGADASKLLGHSSRAVTERHYLSPEICPRVQASDVLPRPADVLFRPE